MFSLIIKKALLQDPGRSWRVVFSVALGTAVTTSVLGVSIGIGDQVQREFRSYGANIQVTGARSQSASAGVNLGGIRYAVAEDSASVPVTNLGVLKTVFWRNNILGFAPFLTTTMDLQGRPVQIVGTWFRRPVRVPSHAALFTGVRSVEPWWKVSGAWPADLENAPVHQSAAVDCLAGVDLARDRGLHTGSLLAPIRNGVPHPLRVVGIVTTGGVEDNELIIPLSAAQQWADDPGMAQRVELSALVKPDDALAHKDPKSLSDADREKLSCSPYISQITSEIEDALPGVIARPVYRVADSEGKMLGRIQLLMLFVLVAAVVASLLGAGAATAAAAAQRRPEMGLVKALGARRVSLLAQIASEAALLGLAGGLIGVPLGIGLQRWIGVVVFGTPAPIPWIVVPLGLILAPMIAVVSSIFSLWSAVQVDPVQVLGGD